MPSETRTETDESSGNFYTTRAAQTVTAVTGSVSAISSFLIILFIMRSGTKLSSPYHRIMFFMSFWDMALSITMALTIIPMPADVDERMYPFDGKSYGSIVTCEVQGFLYCVFTAFCITSNSALCIFYVCTIRYGMKEETVKRVLLPSLLFLCTTSALSFPFFMLVKNLFNPTPFDPFCSYAPLPFECSEQEQETDNYEGTNIDEIWGAEQDVNTYDPSICIRGDQFSYFLTQILVMIFLGSNFSILLVSMILIFLKVRNHGTSRDGASLSLSDRNISLADDTSASAAINTNIQNATLASAHVYTGHNNNNNNNNNERNVSVASSSSIDLHEEEMELERTKLLELRKTIVLQAGMYVGAFLLTWISTLLCIILVIFGQSHVIQRSSTIALLRLTFEPLQGLFNALIFFYHKMHSVRQSDIGDGWWEALWIVMFSPSSVPDVFLSEVDIVIMDSFMNDREQRIARILQMRMDGPGSGSASSAFSQSVAAQDGALRNHAMLGSNSASSNNSDLSSGSSGGRGRAGEMDSNLSSSSSPSSFSQDRQSGDDWSLNAGAGVSSAGSSSHILSLGVIREGNEEEEESKSNI